MNLGARTWQIVEHLALGQDDEQIAAALGMFLDRVRYRINGAMQEHKFANRRDLVLAAAAENERVALFLTVERACTTGKRRYSDEAAATRVLAGVQADRQRRGAVKREARGYRCVHCFGWHLTSMHLPAGQAGQAREHRGSLGRPLVDGEVLAALRDKVGAEAATSDATREPVARQPVAFAATDPGAHGTADVPAVSEPDEHGNADGPAAPDHVFLAEDLLDGLVALVLRVRSAALAERRYPEADALRDGLFALGLTLQDSRATSSTTWRLPGGLGDGHIEWVQPAPGWPAHRRAARAAVRLSPAGDPGPVAARDPVGPRA